MEIERVIETCLYVDDLDTAERFYRDVLHLKPFAKVEGRHVFFRCGNGVFLLFDPNATSKEDGKLSAPPHGAYGAGHVAFAVCEEDMAGWCAHFKGLGIEIEQEIDWPNGGHSIYFRDPAGNSLELAMPQVWGLSD